MKISTSQMFDNSVSQMNRQQSKIAEMQAKLASGKQIVKASDDAEKSAIIQRLQTAIDRQTVYERSLDMADNRLAAEESALMSSETILQRIRELAVRGSTDTLSVADKEILANEVISLQEELKSLANTQDANGNYVFAGSAVQAKAFDINAEELKDLVNPNRFVGRAPEQVAHFLHEQVTPMLKRLGKNAEELQSTELHV